jgi:hypothetical protein
MTQVPPSEPEFLGPPTDTRGSSSHPRRGFGRRWAVTGVAAAAVLGAVGAGAWGVGQLMAGGDSPAAAVPATAVAYVGLDLDPSASQKIEALRTLKKFPALAEQLDLGVRDDLRAWLFEQLQEQGTCEQVDYATDIEPWLGDRMAVAAVPGAGNRLEPLVVLQTSDPDAAADATDRLAACSGEDLASVVSGDYLMLTERQRAADAMAEAVTEGALADDPDYLAWTERAGEPGVVSAYVSAELPEVLQESQGGDTGSFFAYTTPGTDLPVETDDAWSSLYDDFEGAAAVVRFADGSVQAELAAGGLPGAPAGEQQMPPLSTLPETTAFALSAALPEGWLTDSSDLLVGMLSSAGPGGPGSSASDDPWAEFEAGTPLDLPGDIESLLGDGVTLAVDGSVDLGVLDTGDPSDLPVGLRISGDPAEITRVLDLLLAEAGPVGRLVTVEEDADGVRIGLAPEYVDALGTDGALGDSPGFERVLPEADRSGSAVYLDFDAADGWADRLATELSGGDPEVQRNVAPLDALGASSWTEDGVQHGLLTMTVD